MPDFDTGADDLLQKHRAIWRAWQDEFQRRFAERWAEVQRRRVTITQTQEK